MGEELTVVDRTYVDLLLRLVSLIANMWTVPLSLETHRKDESALKLILKKHGKCVS